MSRGAAKKAEQAYNDLALDYDEKYVDGENNPYMQDEIEAARHWKKFNKKGKIVSLGCGTGQDVSILGYPDPHYFIGYDISEGMLAKARLKHPDYTFIQADCSEPICDDADILVAMFGVPNYIGIDILADHIFFSGAKHGFCVFYNEHYVDGIVENYYRYTRSELETIGNVEPLGSNYYTVTW